MNDLFRINDFVQYLNRVSCLSDCLIVLAVKDTLGHNIGENGYNALHNLGITKTNYENRYKDSWKGFVSVIRNGQIIYEELSEYGQTVRYNNIIEGVSLDILSCPYICGNYCSILIDDHEYSVNERGLNIVVYSLLDKFVVDSVAFDTHVPQKECKRDMTRQFISVKPYLNNDLIIRDLNNVRSRYSLESILGCNSVISEANSKIKIRFFFWGGYNLWNAIESVVEAFLKDDHYDVLVVFSSFDSKTIYRATKNNINFTLKDHYVVENDSPDITIYNWKDVYYSCKSIKYSVQIPATIIDGGISSLDSKSILDSLVDESKVDDVLVEKNLYRLSSGLNYEKWREFGNPKFDLIYNYVNGLAPCAGVYDKIKDKCIFLWAFDHNWKIKSSSFDLYIKTILSIFLRRKESALIIRPHRNFTIELVQSQIWSKDELTYLKNYCENTENIIWDDTLDYGEAYGLADAIITDVNCGICISALPLDVPISVLCRYDGNECLPQYPEVYENLYKIKSETEVESFVDMVLSGDDPMKRDRELLRERYISNFDGKNGERIKEFISKRYEEIVNG